MESQGDISNEDWVDDSDKVVSAGFIEYFILLKDPKTVRKTNHFLLEIIFTAWTYRYKNCISDKGHE